MRKHTDIWDELQNEPSEPPFRVPEGYFDTLEDRIKSRIEEEFQPVSQKGKVIRILKPLLGMAASFALVFLLVYYPLSVYLPDYLAKNTDNPEINPEVASEEDLLFSYFSITSNSVYDLFADNEIATEEEISSEEMLDYLTLSMNEAEIYAELK
ncbi:hypothetical protein [uncultured Sunxiuqinia sp.]|uniref:hypothetical protein n=1 Tax=uncultured Sunxiuqinia sp. TaxID=1573825 RepID=UPI002AA77DD1|nr:hypothetical protein [uncultured Sunxiuqinia sp.]